MALALHLCLILICPLLCASSSLPQIDATFLKSLENNDKTSTSVLISMKEDEKIQKIRHYLKVMKDIPTTNRTERLNSVTNLLQDHSNQSQKNILEFLHTEKTLRNPDSQFTFTQLWITNQILVKNGDLTLLKTLIEREDIEKIEENKVFFMDLPVPFKIYGNPSHKSKPKAGYQWGVEKIRAPAVYDVTQGEGIVVASIDTGTSWTHEALVSNYRIDHGWFNAQGTHTRYPFDDQGHGTHTLGTIVGNVEGIGVAPGAKWISCKAGDADNGFSQADVIQCAQWVLWSTDMVVLTEGQYFQYDLNDLKLFSPTDYEGLNQDCSKAPHVVSSSWGWSDGGWDFFNDAIAAWRAAQIVPIFCNGNNGPSCSKVWYPAEHPDVIGVGSTTNSDELSTFSSPGPIPTYPGTIKPDVSAPGSNVYSSLNSGDGNYGYMSGTSMATPHVAGLVALMLSKNPDLSYNQIKSYLQQGSVHIVSSGSSCGGISDTQYPNYHAGSGRIDAWNSFNLVSPAPAPHAPGCGSH